MGGVSLEARRELEKVILILTFQRFFDEPGTHSQNHHSRAGDYGTAVPRSAFLSRQLPCRLLAILLVGRPQPPMSHEIEYHNIAHHQCQRFRARRWRPIARRATAEQSYVNTVSWRRRSSWNGHRRAPIREPMAVARLRAASSRSPARQAPARLRYRMKVRITAPLSASHRIGHLAAFPRRSTLMHQSMKRPTITNMA